MKKPCSVCGVPKDALTEFHSNGAGRRRSACKLCEHLRVERLRARGLSGGRKKTLHEFFAGLEDGYAPLAGAPRHFGASEPFEREDFEFDVDVEEGSLIEKGARRYIITWAQNATPIREDFWEALHRYCEGNAASLVVIPGRYKNPTSLWNDNNRGAEWWDDRTIPYLLRGKLTIGNLTVHGDIPIQPTAKRPLTGQEVYVGTRSAVFGHPKSQMVTVATNTRHPRVMQTTGACTVTNYTHSKAGKHAEAHHTFSALVVELAADGQQVHIRRVSADETGSFYDLTHYYTPDDIHGASRIEALVCGDIHVAKPEPSVLDGTLYAEDSIVQVLRPKRIVYHDVHDQDTRNHHRIKDPIDRWERAAGLANDFVERELRDSIAFLDSTPSDAEVFVIGSNHDEALDKWIRTTDWRDDPTNAETYIDLVYHTMKDRRREGVLVPVFESYYRRFGNGRATFIRRDGDLMVLDIDLAYHGDKGINGARGSGMAYAKLGVKTIIGHGHSPFILDGCYAVGVTGRLNQGYNHKPSSWKNSHVIVYPNGKRTHIHVLPDGTWRAPEVYDLQQHAA